LINISRWFSAVWGHCEITMRYLNGLEPGPLSLMSLARLQIRKSLGPARLPLIHSQLALPRSIKHYLRYEDCYPAESQSE
jgi:SPRY domain-containing SOCS box protein 1/4